MGKRTPSPKPGSECKVEAQQWDSESRALGFPDVVVDRGESLQPVGDRQVHMSNSFINSGRNDSNNK